MLVWSSLTDEEPKSMAIGDTWEERNDKRMTASSGRNGPQRKIGPFAGPVERHGAEGRPQPVTNRFNRRGRAPVGALNHRSRSSCAISRMHERGRYRSRPQPAITGERDTRHTTLNIGARARSVQHARSASSASDMARRSASHASERSQRCRSRSPVVLLMARISIAGTPSRRAA